MVFLLPYIFWFSGPVNRYLEVLKHVAVLAPHHVYKVRGEHEGDPLALDSVEGLCVTKKVAEVDVEQISSFGHHDVVVVPISDSCGR